MSDFNLDSLEETLDKLKGSSPSSDKVSINLDTLEQDLDTFDKQNRRNIKPGFNISDYSKYTGEVFDPSDPMLDVNRADLQSTGAKMLGTLNKAVVGEIVGGTLEGIGHFGDIAQTINALEGETQEWGNWLTDIGQGLRTWAEEATPVYTDPNSQGKFAPWTADWWYNNAPSMASTLSLMIPSAGIVKGASLLGKALKIGQEMGKVASFATRGIGQAVASRLMENGMEALGNYNDTLESLKAQGIDEETAKIQASAAASRTWNLNWAMLAQDIPQYMLLNSTLGKSLKATGEETPSVLNALGKSATKARLSKVGSIGLDMLGEAGEEAYQFAVNESSKRLSEVALGLRDEETLGEQLREYVKDGEFWTSAAIGALGAGVMQTAGKRINNAIARYNGVMTPEQRRVQNIKDWSAQRKYWQDIIEDAKVTGDIDKETMARQGLIRTMGINAATNQNLGALRDMFESVRDGKHSQKDLETLGITEEELPDIQKNADSYIKTLNSIEEKYNNYVELNLKKPTVPDNLLPLLVQEEVRLDDLRSRKGSVESEKNSLQGTMKNFNALDSISQQMQMANINIQILKENNKKLNEHLEKFKDTLSDEAVEIVKKNIQRNEDKIKSINKEVQESKKSDTRTKEEKEASKNFNNQQSDVRRYAKLLSLENQVDNGINASTEMISTMLDKKYQKKVSEQVNLHKEKSLIKAVREAKRLVDLEEAKANSKGTPAEPIVNKTINKLKNEDIPNYYKSDEVQDLNKVYKEGDKEKAKFADDIKELSSLISNKLIELSKDASGDELAKLNALQDRFLPDKSIDDINESIKILKGNVALAQFTGNNVSVDQQLLDIIKDFINSKAEELEEEFDDEIKEFLPGTQEVIKDDANITEIVPKREADVINNWEYEFELKNGKWVPTGEKADPFIKSDRYNPDLINNPKMFPSKTIIRLEVDFGENYSPNKKQTRNNKGEEVEITPNNFQIQLVAYDKDGNGHIIGTLPDADNVAINDPNNSTKDASLKAKQRILVNKRAEIWKEIQVLPKKDRKGVYQTKYYTTIERKNAGRIFRVKKMSSPHELLEGTEYPLYFTVIYSDKDGNKYASTPNIPSGPYRTAVTDSFIKNAEVGAVYMLVPASNGAIIPVRMFTNRVQDLSKKDRTELTNRVKELLLSTTIENKKSVNKEINKSVYLVYNYKDGVFYVKTPGNKQHSFTKEQLKNSPEILDNILDKMIVQIDRNAINTGNYNETISKQGRLKANLNPKRFTHSASFQIDLTGIKPGETKPLVKTKKPTEKPLETGSNSGGKNETTKGSKVAITTTKKEAVKKIKENLQSSGIISNFEDLLKAVDEYSESLKVVEEEIREAEHAEGKEIQKECEGRSKKKSSTGRTKKTPASTPKNKPKDTPSKGDTKTGVTI